MNHEPWSPAAFEARYREDPDPWDFGTSSYEQARYRSIMAALPRLRYRSAYEPGCSVGELTALLAERCLQVVAVDVSSTAVERARARCSASSGVTLSTGSVEDDPGVSFDLVVMSEVGYYFSEPDLEAVIDRLTGALEPGGDLVACHWTGSSADHVLSGSVVHDHLLARTDLDLRVSEDHGSFLIGAWRHP